MSFGPPPSKTRYGDQDFIKEDDTPQQRPFSTPPSPNQNSRGYPPYSAPPPAPPPIQTPYGQPMPPVSGVDPSVQTDVRSMARSLTPEDMLFLRSWRQDSFYYRVLPITAVGTGALFYYYKSKNLPHKYSRYLLVSLAGYFLGKMSYKGELKRRLEANPSNTPFMQGMRNLVGAQPPMSSMGEFSGDTSQDYSPGLYNRNQPDSWGSNDTKTGDAGFPRRSQVSPPPSSAFGQPAGYGQYNQGSPSSTYQPYESDLGSSGAQPSGEPPKPVYSYEELRARNRGLVQK